MSGRGNVHVENFEKAAKTAAFSFRKLLVYTNSTMHVTFITTNKHKFEEVSDILKPYPIELEWLRMAYEENHDASIEEVARGAAKKLAEELRKPIVLEDTGLFFEAYNGFPGALPKFVYNAIGFKGIMKLLDGEKRGAYFKTVAGFCEPGKEPLLFEGVMHGTISERVHNEGMDAMPYDLIFIPQGYDRTVSDIPLQEKNSISQRGQAFRKFGDFIKENFR